MFEISGGSPTLGAYGDCCSCCAKVSVTTPASATTLANTLAPHATSVLFIVVASLFARGRERFAIVIVILTRRKRALHPPNLPPRHAHMGPFLRWSGTRFGLQSVHRPTMAASRLHDREATHAAKAFAMRIGNDA